MDPLQTAPKPKAPAPLSSPKPGSGVGTAPGPGPTVAGPLAMQPQSPTPHLNLPQITGMPWWMGGEKEKAAPVAQGPGPGVGAFSNLFGMFGDSMPGLGVGPLAGLAAGTATAGAGALTGPAAAPQEEKLHYSKDTAKSFDANLDAAIAKNFATRAKLDKEHHDKADTAADTEKTLNTDRKELLSSLKERSGVLDTEIKGIQTQLGTEPIKKPTPEQAALIAQRDALVKEKAKYAPQQTALQRWTDRNEINDINTKIKNPDLDAKERKTLLDRKKELATGLLSTTTEYEQFDARWGSTVYGNSYKGQKNSTMTEGGCGPTSLAMLLDFKDQEDPEGNYAQGHKNTITPRTAADYATNHGRAFRNGTDGTKMMAELEQGFPGKQGKQLTDRAAAMEALKNGQPVMFLGHNISGTKADGKAANPYGGHFMVLNGVSDDGKNYEVLDGGRNEQRDFASISSKQLDNGADGYWIVE